MRLNHFDVVSGAVGKSIARLREGLLGQIDVAHGYRNLVCRCLQVQKPVSDVLLDLSLQVLRLLPSAIEFRLGHQGVAVRSIPGENGDVECGESAEGAA